MIEARVLGRTGLAVSQSVLVGRPSARGLIWSPKAATTTRSKHVRAPRWKRHWPKASRCSIQRQATASDDQSGCSARYWPRIATRSCWPPRSRWDRIRTPMTGPAAWQGAWKGWAPTRWTCSNCTACHGPTRLPNGYSITRSSTRWKRSARGDGQVIGITAEVPSGGLERLIDTGRFDVLQMAYSLIYQGACDYQREPFGIIPRARALGMGILGMRAATSGVLHKLLSAEFPDLDPHRVTRLALRFVLSTPEVDSALVGMRTPAEVAANTSLVRDLTARMDVKALHDFFDGRAAIRRRVPPRHNRATLETRANDPGSEEETDMSVEISAGVEDRDIPRSQGFGKSRRWISGSSPIRWLAFAAASTCPA